MHYSPLALAKVFGVNLDLSLGSDRAHLQHTQRPDNGELIARDTRLPHLWHGCGANFTYPPFLPDQFLDLTISELVLVCRG